MDGDTKRKINNAWYEAQRRRPYKLDLDAIPTLTPGGGEWRVELQPDAYAILWGKQSFAVVSHGLGVHTAGEVAMGMRATPVMDTALRSIMVLAEDAANLPLIIEIARTVVAYIEMPAPKPPEPDEEDGDGDGELNDE